MSKFELQLITVKFTKKRRTNIFFEDKMLIFAIGNNFLQ